MITADGLSYAYRDGFQIRSLSFTVRQGSMTGIIGPNGSGKSTFLKLLLKMIPAPPGTLFINDSDIHALSQRELARLVGYVPQATVPDQAFSVRQMVAMGRFPHRSRFFSFDETDPLVDEAIDRLQLTHLAERPVTKVSGGEFQRVLTARALAQDTPIVALDEPTNHLDLRHQLLLLDLLQKERERAGLTVIAVFHDLNLAIEYCDEILVFNDGALEIACDPTTLVSGPTLERVYGIGFERIARAEGARTLLMGKL